MNSEYITLFRRKMNGLEKVKEQDWHELQILSDKLFNEVEQAITNYPKKNYTKLSSTLNELNAEKQSAKRSIDTYKSKLDLAGLDDYTSNFQVARECYVTLESTIADLYVLLAERYPETLHNKVLRNEIAKAIPPFHSLGKVVKAKIRILNEADKNTTQTQITPQATADLETPPPAITGIPVFNPDIIEPVYSILKAHFATEQHIQLKELLITGVTSGKLHFKSTGNRLSDAFRALIDEGAITGCIKLELAEWVYKNFMYKGSEVFKEYKLRTLKDTIQATECKCANPLFGVSQDKLSGKYSLFVAKK